MTLQSALLTTTDGRTMALERVSASGTVRGLLLELAVEQRYRNAGTTNAEVVYTFPLPFDAVLLDLDIELGARVLHAVVVERREAEERYEETLEKGDTAVMLERRGDGLCTLNLGNLLAGETATIRYTYAQLLRFNHGSVRIAVPTVIAPRYGDPAAAGLDGHQVPESDVCVAYPFALRLALEGDVAQGSLDSPSHPIAVERTDAGLVVTLARNGWLDRDFILDVGGLAGRSLATVVRDGEAHVALASFVAPRPADGAEVPLSLKLLVDRSGSMGGDSIAAAKRALHRVLESLQPTDVFSLSSFGSSVQHMQEALVRAAPEAVRLAAHEVGRFDADLGGTEMEAALRAVFALRGNGPAQQAAADVLIITDGEVFGADALVAAARAAKQRVFAVGIGSAPAEGVLRALADATGGACEFVAPNEDAEAAILRMFARLRAPRIARVDIAWPQAPLWTTALPSGLFGGETIHVFAGFATPPMGQAMLSLRPVGEGAAINATIALPQVAEAAALPRIAAARRIEAADAKDALALALRYGLLTDRTNLLVVAERAEGEKAVDLPELQKIAQMHAAGWGGVGSVVHEQRIAACLTMPITRRLASGSRAVFEGAGTLDLASVDVAREPPDLRFSVDRDASMLDDAVPIEEWTDRRRDAGVDILIQNLARGVPLVGRARLPSSVAELCEAGLDGDRAMDLIDLMQEGNEEVDVVRAFLELLGNQMAASGKYRRLRRVLRTQFATADECKALREQVAARFANIEVTAHIS